MILKRGIVLNTVFVATCAAFGEPILIFVGVSTRVVGFDRWCGRGCGCGFG